MQWAIFAALFKALPQLFPDPKFNKMPEPADELLSRSGGNAFGSAAGIWILTHRRQERGVTGRRDMNSEHVGDIAAPLPPIEPLRNFRVGGGARSAARAPDFLTP